MSGMEPMLIGAALGGGISAARGGNPITGALLGGIGGGVYGAASGMAPAMAGATQTAGIADLQRLLQVGQAREGYEQQAIQGRLAAQDIPLQR